MPSQRKYNRLIQQNKKAQERADAYKKQKLFENISNSLRDLGVTISYDNTQTNVNLVDVYGNMQGNTDLNPTTYSTENNRDITLDQCGVCDGGIYECNILNFNTKSLKNGELSLSAM